MKRHPDQVLQDRSYGNVKPPTSKERVLKVHPDARCYVTRETGSVWCKIRSGLETVGRGNTARQAWANAAANLKGKGK